MKIISSIHCDIQLEEKDYFLVHPDGNNIKITLTNGNGRPLKLVGITRKQIFLLISQLNKVMLFQNTNMPDNLTCSVEEIMGNIETASSDKKCE